MQTGLWFRLFKKITAVRGMQCYHTTQMDNTVYWWQQAGYMQQ